MPLKRDEAFWKEGMDEKRFALCCIHKIWICLAAALASAVFAAGIYLGVRQLTMGPKQYRSEVLYSIVYDIDEDDEVLKEFINEYNAYTWGDMMRSDRVMDTVLLQLPDVERSVIEASISTEIASDPEFLTAYFTTEDAALSDRIAAAYNRAMTAFGQTMQGRGLTTIEVWKTVPAQAVLPENKVKNAAVLGLVLGLLAGILGVAVWYVLDDSVLLSSDVEKRCAIPILGYRTAKPDEQFGALLDAQLRAKASQSAFQEISLDTVLSGTMGLGEEEKIPLILLVRWNTPCIKKLGLALDLLAQREIAVVGVILTDADARFLHAYYRM